MCTCTYAIDELALKGWLSKAHWNWADPMLDTFHREISRTRSPNNLYLCNWQVRRQRKHKLNKIFRFSVDTCWNNNLPRTTGQRLGRGGERPGGVLDSARGWQAAGHGSRGRKRQGERGRWRRVLRHQSPPPGSGHREPQPRLWAYSTLPRHRRRHCEYIM